VAFDILQEKTDIHKQIQVIRLSNLVIFLGTQHKYFVFGVLGWQNVHLGIIQRRLDDMQFEWGQRRQSKVAYLPDFSLVGSLNWQRSGLEMEG